MRLNKYETSAILTSVTSFNLPAHSRLLLFGSRSDSTKKGGDIDLVLILADLNKAKEFNKISYKILAKIKQALQEEQKIDLAVISAQQALEDEFWLHALKHAVLLKHF